MPPKVDANWATCARPRHARRHREPGERRSPLRKISIQLPLLRNVCNGAPELLYG